MLEKIAGLGRALGIILAVLAGLVALPGFDTTSALLVLGAVAGLTASGQQLVNLAIAAVALPVVAGQLGKLMAAGGYLAGIFDNLGIHVAGAVAMGVAITVVKTVRAGLLGLGPGGAASAG